MRKANLTIDSFLHIKNEDILIWIKKIKAKNSTSKLTNFQFKHTYKNLKKQKSIVSKKIEKSVIKKGKIIIEIT